MDASQLQRYIPLLRRPFHQRDKALEERDQARMERDRALMERDLAIAERDQLIAERDIRKPFSLLRLRYENPGLAAQFLWDTNPAIAAQPDPWLHLGCGARVLEGFVNLDVCPQDGRVIRWDLLDLWPNDLEQCFAGAFSEDCFEHFYHGEQVYILCNINRALRTNGVARILMPSITRLFELYSGGFQHGTYAMETFADNFNYGMRFTGHRWLHDVQSIGQMSAACGFDMTVTDCASSGVAKFNALNLRDESNSASFANDLTKARHISRVLIAPSSVNGAEKVEDIAADTALFVATVERPAVEFALPKMIGSETVACINVRSSGLSAFDWGLTTLILDEHNCRNPWHFDETMRSHSSMNVITGGQIRLTLGGDKEFSHLTFSPAAGTGEYFALGTAEIFLLD
jgi:hypothetical protein